MIDYLAQLHGTAFRRLVFCPYENKGFTLLELIASLVLLGLITAIFGMGLVAALQSNEFSRSNVQTAQKAQLAMMRISRELSELTLIEAVSADSDDPFIIYRRIDPSHDHAFDRYGLHYEPGSGNLVLYTNLSSGITTLNGTTAANADILIDNVRSFALSYFQGGDTWVWGSDPALLSAIGVTLQLTRPEKPTHHQDFSTVVQLRNTENFGGAAPATRPVSRDDYSCFVKTIFQTLSHGQMHHR
ncbi:MAG: prepilin-type N-terminal cleavage/methylation domain-containing protein [Desulfobacteraceae bacterium]|jgi:prepilin-type N-terminal cleavage/methylation domain-containing protein